MSVKTPTSVLWEFCNQYKETPVYNPVSQETDSSVPVFTFSVVAQNHMAKGSGRTKTDAKHVASQNLINILSQQDRYKNKFCASSWKLNGNEKQPSEVFNAVGFLETSYLQRKIPEPVYMSHETGQDHKKQFTTRCNVGQFESVGKGSTKKESKNIAASEMIKLINSKNTTDLNGSNSSDTQNFDAVGALINFCRQRYPNLPNFDCIAIGGKDHQKEFESTCTVDNQQCTGRGFQKKEAKQKAAQEMLNLLNGNSELNSSSSDSLSLSSCSDASWVLPLEELPSVDDVLAEYRRIKKQHYIKPIANGIRYRKNFFMNLPKKNRDQAIQIMKHKSYFGGISPKKMVDAVLRALGLKYQIDVKSRNHIFSLIESEYDCVLIGKSYNIYEKVFEYLKVMLNVPNSLDFSNSDGA